jgi:hypothetical protein
LAAEPEVNHGNIYEGLSFSWPRSVEGNFLAKLYGFAAAPDWFGKGKVNFKERCEAILESIFITHIHFYP